MEASPDLGQRALIALAELRALLGPNALETEGALDDASTLEQHVDDGLAALRRMLPGYTGPEAASVAALALELGEIRLMLAGERVARRLDGVLQVQRALARLRAVGSTEQMLAKAPEAVCTYCGFAVAILWRVEEGVVTPVSAFSARDPGWDEKVRRVGNLFTGKEDSTNVPVVTNLRQDPWERYQTEGMLYGRWWGEKLWTMVPAVTIVGEFLATFTDYPPSQASGTLSVEKALTMLQEGSLKN